MALMDREQIKEIIPHRDPFLLIDEIESMDEEKGEITAIKYVKESEYYFEGHFPQKKVMPGVLIVEALAQAESGGAGRYAASFRDDGKAGLQSGNSPRNSGNSAAGRRFWGRKTADRLPV